MDKQKLNKLMAEKVMKKAYTILGCGIPESHIWRESVMIDNKPFNPCDSIADALLVFEKRFTTHGYVYDDATDTYIARGDFGRCTLNYCKYSAQDESLSLAIVLAIEKTLEDI